MCDEYVPHAWIVDTCGRCRRPEMEHRARELRAAIATWGATNVRLRLVGEIVASFEQDLVDTTKLVALKRDVQAATDDKGEAFVTADDADTLFCGAETIALLITTFLDGIRERRRDNPAEVCVGDLFADLGPCYKEYIRACTPLIHTAALPRYVFLIPVRSLPAHLARMRTRRLVPQGTATATGGR